MARAAIAANLGQREQAVALIEQAFTEGLAELGGLHADPWFASLRGYRPFEALQGPRG
jgi:hypothetical protein